MEKIGSNPYTVGVDLPTMLRHSLEYEDDGALFADTGMKKLTGEPNSRES